MEPFIGLSLFIIFGVVAVFFLNHFEKMRAMNSSLGKLQNSFEELDEQAKLIVKTDLELNKAQEELDKRIHGLDALQKISQLITRTLDEGEIFQRLQQPLLTQLGFEKYLILIFDPRKKLQPRVQLGFTEIEAGKIAAEMDNAASIFSLLKKGQVFSSPKADPSLKYAVINIFAIRYFIIAPIMAQEKMLGVIFAGNQGDTFSITEGDEELISILASQIGQSVENARLFEQAYRSTQLLETKVQERTKELSSALEEVRKISKTKSEFISAVSHELRTPLTSIKGYASILMTGKLGAIPAEVKERLDRINKHTDSLVKLINDLLDIARIESGRTELKFVKHPLASVVDSVQDLLTPQMKEKDIRFVHDIAADIPEIEMDISQIERMFINLVGNAIKFTPVKGTIRVDIKRQDDGTVEAAVSDTGIGISEENMSKLFSEFYRVENTINQNVKGSGLGLALAKKIVEAHHGKIWVTSKIREGTTFHLTLPVDAPRDPE